MNKHGIVEIIVNGDQTVESVQAMGAEALHLVHEQRAAGKPALLLDNLTRMGKVPPEARKRVVELARDDGYDKLAMVGSNAALKLAANLLLQAIGKSRNIKYFDDYDKAVKWLKEV